VDGLDDRIYGDEESLAIVGDKSMVGVVRACEADDDFRTFKASLKRSFLNVAGPSPPLLYTGKIRAASRLAIYIS